MASLGLEIWRVVLLIVMVGAISITTIEAHLHPFLALILAAAVYGTSCPLPPSLFRPAMRCAWPITPSSSPTSRISSRSFR